MANEIKCGGPQVARLGQSQEGTDVPLVGEFIEFF
jgi:hypothetical protein